MFWSRRNTLVMLGTTFSWPTISGLVCSLRRGMGLSASPTAALSGSRWLLQTMELVFNVLESAELLADACRSFTTHCASGIGANAARIREHLDGSLMLVTALSPHIGYEKSAAIALLAHREGLKLRDAALKLGYVSAEEFDAWVRPEEMTGRSGTRLRP